MTDTATNAPRGRVSARVRIFVAVVLGAIMLCGFVGIEAWPLTAFRLFSAARKSHEIRWVATTVDSHGVETPLNQQNLPLGYRLAEWPMQRFPSSSTHTRNQVCKGIAEGARRAGREVDEVRVYRVRDQLHQRGTHWVITSQPVLYATCGPSVVGGT
jgi:hypothetical protein